MGVFDCVGETDIVILVFYNIVNWKGACDSIQYKMRTPSTYGQLNVIQFLQFVAQMQTPSTTLQPRIATRATQKTSQMRWPIYALPRDCYTRRINRREIKYDVRQLNRHDGNRQCYATIVTLRFKTVACTLFCVCTTRVVL